jgi:hypothetical protein
MTSIVNSAWFGNGGVTNVGGNFNATGANYMRIWVYAEGSVTVSSVVFGAQSLTLIPGSAFGNWLGCYELVAPAQSTQDARFTLNASSGRLLAYISAWSGVNQSTPSRTPTGLTGNSAAPSITVLGNAGDVDEAVCMMANAAFTFDTSQGGIEIQHADNWVSTFRSFSAAYDVTEDSPFTWNAGAAANFWAVGIPIIASGGAGAPSITNVDGDNIITATQSNWPINGSGFNSATVSIIQGSTTKAQTVNAGQTATQIFCNTVFDGGGAPHLKYGAGTARVTNADTQFGNQAITVVVPSGKLAVDIIVPNATASNRITAVPDIAAGDQLEMSNVVGGTIADINVNPDATFDCAASVVSFDVRCWSTADSTWGAIGTQVVSGGQVGGGTGVVGIGVVGTGVVGPLGVDN